MYIYFTTYLILFLYLYNYNLCTFIIIIFFVAFILPWLKNIKFIKYLISNRPMNVYVYVYVLLMYFGYFCVNVRGFVLLFNRYKSLLAYIH